MLFIFLVIALTSKAMFYIRLSIFKTIPMPTVEEFHAAETQRKTLIVPPKSIKKNNYVLD